MYKSLMLIALSFAGGGLAAFSMAPTQIWGLLFLGLSGLYILLNKVDTRRMAAALGWSFGFGYFLFGVSWVANALLVEGNPYGWAWPIAVCGLPALLAVFPALACFCVKKFAALDRWHGYMAFAGWMALFEWVRGHIFTGFPWNLYGYTWAETLEIAQIVAWGSIYSLTALTILWAALPGYLYLGRDTKAQKSIVGILITISILACYGYGAWKLTHTPTTYNESIAVKVVHPNIPQNEKWAPDKIVQHFFKRIRLSYPAPEQDTKGLKATYIIWPETALSQRFVDDPTALHVLTQALQAYDHPAYLITGFLSAPTGTPDQVANAMVMIDKNGTLSNLYKKHHLVPFGEYMPFKDLIPLAPINNFPGFEAGESLATLSTPENISYSPLICYEAIFPAAVIQNTNTSRPDMMINVTNDAWYGQGAGAHQHLQNARFRAIEEGVPLLRSANMGLSAIIDPSGRILKKADFNNPQTLLSLLPENLHVFEGKQILKTMMFLVILAITIVPVLVISRLRED